MSLVEFGDTGSGLLGLLGVVFWAVVIAAAVFGKIGNQRGDQ